MITYGSYLPKDVSIPKSAVTVSLVDTCVAIIAGLAIFPVVFANNLDFEAGRHVRWGSFLLLGLLCGDYVFGLFA